jgi:hypothetical protein
VFDFFLTQPYQHFTITSQADIETAVLLTLVGLAVTEIALWGRRHQARASQQEGYLQGVVHTAGLVAAGSSRIETLIAHVADQLVGRCSDCAWLGRASGVGQCVDVARFEVGPVADQEQWVAIVAVLHRGVGSDLDHEPRLHLDQQLYPLWVSRAYARHWHLPQDISPQHTSPLHLVAAGGVRVLGNHYLPRGQDRQPAN